MPYRLEGCDGLMHLGARRYSTREVVYLCEMHGDGVGRCLAVSPVFPRGSVGACLWARGAALGILFRGGPSRSLGFGPLSQAVLFRAPTQREL